jgi:hypothetical protein
MLILENKFPFKSIKITVLMQNFELSEKLSKSTPFRCLNLHVNVWKTDPYKFVLGGCDLPLNKRYRNGAKEVLIQVSEHALKNCS